MFNKQIVSKALGAEIIDVTIKGECVIVEYSHKNGNGLRSLTQAQLTAMMRKVQ